MFITIQCVPLLPFHSPMKRSQWIQKNLKPTQTKLSIWHMSLDTLKQAAFTPYLQNLPSEARADAWAIKRLIPCDDLKKAVKSGLCDYWDLAEHFNVTESFVKKAVIYYKRKGLI